MTAQEYIKYAIAYRESEETEAEKQKAKFEASNPNGLAKWQTEVIERDRKRIIVINNLISIISAYEMNDSRDDKIAAAYERIENKLVVNSGADAAHYCIQKVARHIEKAYQEIEKQQLRTKTPSIDLVIAIGFLMEADQEICKYLNKYFKSKNIDYVIKY